MSFWMCEIINWTSSHVLKNSVIKIFDLFWFLGWVSNPMCGIFEILKFSDFENFGFLKFWNFKIFDFREFGDFRWVTGRRYIWYEEAISERNMIDMKETPLFHFLCSCLTIVCCSAYVLTIRLVSLSIRLTGALEETLKGFQGCWRREHLTLMMRTSAFIMFREYGEADIVEWQEELDSVKGCCISYLLKKVVQYACVLTGVLCPAMKE